MYHHPQFCQNTKSVDKMFKTFKKTQDEFLSELKKNPYKTLNSLWTVDSIFPTDKDCKYELGRKKDNSSMINRQHFACSMCKSLSSLVDGNGHIQNNRINVKCGNKAGEVLTIEEFNDKSYVNISEEIKQIIYNNINTAYDDATIIELDIFNNEIVQSSILESLWSDNVKKIYSAFLCSHNRYLISENISFINIKDFLANYPNNSVNLVNGIIGQLLVSLRVYSSCALLMGDPGLNSFSIINEPISFEYNGCHVHCPVTLKYNNLSYNSIDLPSKGEKYRFTYVNQVDKMLIKNKITPVINEIDVISEYPTVIRFDGSNFDTYKRYIKTGVPLFAGTWNIYTSFIILMTQPELREQIRSDSNLYSLWEKLWSNANINEINTYIESSNINWRLYFVNQGIQVGVSEDLWKMYKSKNCSKKGK